MRRYLGRGVAFGLVATIVLALAGGLVMTLWNWLMPPIFGFHGIGFWQALGLLVLSKILFGGFHRGGRGWHWRRRMSERWERMSPDEREQFREHFQEWCGRVGRSPGTTVV
jgi:hypothetical protein